MSWASILKEVGLDENEASKACCETARQALIELVDRAFENIDDLLDALDQVDCSDLYEFMMDEQAEWEGMKNMSPEELKEYTNHTEPFATPAFVTKYLRELSDIIDEFGSCMGDVDKIKDEVKPIKELEPIVQKWEKIIKKEPRKGTGKKPQGSTRRLYTDENPKDTVPVKFKTAQDVRETFSSSAFKDKPHKRQSQIINLVEQRARVAAKRAKDPEAKKRLNAAHKVALSRKESSKRKTQRMKS